MIYQPNQPRLLILTKPVTMNYFVDGEPLLEHLKTRLSRDGELIAERDWGSLPDAKIRQLYAEHDTPETQGKYNGLCSLLSGQKSVTFIYRPGEQMPNARTAARWIKKVREQVIGKTNPREAMKGSFRSFIQESLPGYIFEEWDYDNGIHCSATSKDGLREGGIFYRDAILKPDEGKLILLDFEKMPFQEKYLWQIGTAVGNGIFADERGRDFVQRTLKERGLKPSSKQWKETMSAFLNGQLPAFC